MVISGRRLSFWRDERGITMLEALLVTPIVLLAITAMVELGVLMFQWNLSVKAAQTGARLAAVSSPVVGDTAYQTLNADFGTTPQGDPVPSAIRSVSCGAGTTACDATRIDRLITGGDGACATTAILIGMCDVAPWIGEDNVLVTYSRAGLGYVGRPGGTVSTVTVELRNLTFDFLLLDALVPALNSIAIPAHPVSITGEDLSDCLNPPC